MKGLEKMADREYALMALAERDAEREVACPLDALGYSPRIIRGAIRDAVSPRRTGPTAPAIARQEAATSAWGPQEAAA